MTTRILSIIVLALLLAACNSQKQADQTDATEVTVTQVLGDAADLVEQKVMISGSVTHVCRHGGQRLFIIGEDPEKTFKITTGEDIAEFDVSLEGSSILVSGVVKELIIDETYLAEWEAEVMAGAPEMGEGEGERPGEHAHAAGVPADGELADHDEDADHEHGEDADHEHAEDVDHDADADHEHAEDVDHDADAAVDPEAQIKAQLDNIQSIRDDIAESGKDHLSEYWIEAVSFSVLEEAEEAEKAEEAEETEEIEE